MNHLRGWVALMSLVFVVGARSTAGGEYRDPTGFSFVYPDGWFAVAAFQEGAIRETMPPEIQAWLEKNSIDFKKVSVLLVREGHEEFLENMNVVVVPDQLSLNDRSVKDLLNQLTQKYASMGMKLGKLEGQARKIGANQTYVVEYRIVFPFDDSPLIQRQVFIPSGGKTYVVTCTGKAETFADHAPTFESILASLKVPAPISQGFNWNRVLMTGIFGGVVGGLFPLFKKFTAPRNRAPHAET